MSDADVALLEESVDGRILAHIFFSETHSLIVSDRLDEYLQERRLESHFSIESIRSGLERLCYAHLVAFQRTEWGTREYRLTDDGLTAATQQLGDCNTGLCRSLWSPANS